MLKFKIIYKFILVTLLFGALLTLGISAFGFIYPQHGLPTWSHKFSGAALMIVAALHTLINRKKLIKLITEFFDLALGRANPSFCNMDRLIAAFSDHSLESVANGLNLDADELFCTLRNSGVKIKSKSQSMREISLLNDEKFFFAIVLIMERKFKGRNLGCANCAI